MKFFIVVLFVVMIARSDEVDKDVEKKILGYRSRDEFVSEAVLDKLVQIKK